MTKRGMATALLMLMLAPSPSAQLSEPQRTEGEQAQAEREPRQDDQDDTPASGEMLRQRLGLRGSLRSGVWSSSRSLDDRGPLAGTTLWTELAPRVGSHLRVFFDGWLGASDWSRPGDVDGQLRELYVEARAGRFDIRAGKQIIAWGRADGVNPTDNLTPRDLTLLVPEEDDQRTGIPAIRATMHRGSMSLTGIWLTQYRGHTFPLPASPGVVFRKAEPDGAPKQAAIKLERIGGTLEGSLSYFTGFDQLRDLALSPVGGAPALLGSPLALDLRPHRVQVFGGDLATVLGRVGLRAEAAYTRTEDRRGDRPDIKNPTFFMVVGADHTFNEYLYVNVQYLFRDVIGFRSPDGSLDEAQRQAAALLAVVSQQGRERQHGTTVKVSNKWRHETLEAEVSGVFYAAPNQGVLRSKISYAISDRWRVIVGGELLRGEPSTLFDLLRHNSSLYTELRWGF
jgi:hypothetical protein